MRGGDLPGNVISLVGPSGSGKTELLCRLVRWLTARGYQVGVLKHSHHSRPAVTPAAAACRQAGVRLFARPAPGAVEIYGFFDGEPEPGPLLARLAAQVDLLLVEGYKSQPLPKLLMTGSGLEEVLPEPSGIVAFISRERREMGRPVFHPDDIDGLGRLIVGYLGLTGAGKAAQSPPPPGGPGGPDPPG